VPKIPQTPQGTGQPAAAGGAAKAGGGGGGGGPLGGKPRPPEGNGGLGELPK
jgi:hypothetical protein